MNPPNRPPTTNLRATESGSFRGVESAGRSERILRNFARGYLISGSYQDADLVSSIPVVHRRRR